MQTSAELKDLTLGLYRALTSGDGAFLEQIVSRQEGVLVIGTDPREWWIGHLTITNRLKVQMEELGGAFPIIPGDPRAFSAGTVGWVADRAKFRLPDGSEIATRLSLVFEKEDAAWKIVQWHISVGVANEEVVHKELTV